jgi:hypothetical protein
VDGGSAGITVWANEKILHAENGLPDHFVLPVEPGDSGKVSIEAKAENQVVARRNLYFSDECMPPKNEPPWCDKFGHYLTENLSASSVVCGCVVRGDTPAFTDFFLPELPFTGRIILLGAKPGQIFIRHSEVMTLNLDWDPVWAVLMNRRGVAVFCGTSLDKAQPLDGEFGDKRQILHWREVVWHWRHRISPPQHRSLARLWTLYQEKARTL